MKMRANEMLVWTLNLLKGFRSCKFLFGWVEVYFLMELRVLGFDGE